MKLMDLYGYICIDEYSATPKYIQLTNAILSAIEAGCIRENDALPSICDISSALEISKDTAEKAYKNLKKLGVLDSIPGKGFYIANIEFKQNLRICLLFNKLSSYKKIIYDSFIAALGEDIATDLYIYNNDVVLFRNFLTDKKDHYSHFVIIPHFIEGADKACEIINTIPKQKLVMLDKKIPDITGDYAAVYEDFENDIYKALKQAGNELSKYCMLKLIFPGNSYYPKEIIKGFSKFCQEYSFNSKVVDDITEEPIHEGEAYINLREDDLVTLIERVLLMKFEIGKQVGIISYNETPIKRIILDGITTISTNFNRMGDIAAKLILENSRAHIEVPFDLILRPSL